MKKFEKIVEKLIEKNPFFFHIYQSLNKQFVEGLGTMGVSLDKKTNSFVLLIDKDLIEKENIDFLVEILEHEILHIIFKHLIRLKNKQIQLWNIATDYVVNKNIGGEILKKGINLETIKELIKKEDIKKDELAEYYYELLNNNKNNNTSQSNSNSQNQNNNSQNNNSNNNQSYGITHNPEKSHKHWKEIAENEVTKEIVEQTINEIVKKAYQKTAGNIPGNLKEFIETEYISKKIKWTDIFKNLFRKQIDIIYKRNFKFRFSRRYNTFPAIKRIKEGTNIAVILDTSASIQEKEYQAFIGELKNMLNLYDIKKIRFIQIDTKINEDKIINTSKLKRNSKIEIKGFGGTDMRPAFDKLKEDKFNGLAILFTDGDLFKKIDGKNYNYDILTVYTHTDKYLENVKKVKLELD